MAKQTAFLSKSKYLHALRCPKLLWYEYNRRKELPPFNAEVLEIMKQGRIVGELAQKLFPEGIKIERDWNPQEMNKKSLKESKKRKPLFEAGFTYKHGYALADILVPAERDSWDLMEVKSSSTIKDEHFHDVAFQKYVYEGSGIKIRQCFILHLNRDYVRTGELELDKLFKKIDISVEALELVPEVEEKMGEIFEIIAAEEPDVEVGQHCKGCPLEARCWAFLPDNHVFLLRGNKKIAYALMGQGILAMKDIPKDWELNNKQSIQVEAHTSNKPYMDKNAISSFIDELKYPLYFFDFETIAPAVPIYNNSRPFEDIPFQFSLHVVKSQGAEPVHHSCLAPGNVDPRPEVLKKLKKLLGNQGSIIAYFAEYEKKCLRYAVRTYPEYNEWFVAIKKRFVDLLVPFKSLSYYHPAQNGSASIKDVLPALTGISYDGMEIGEGGMARFEYMRVSFEKGIEEKERQRVRNALEKYCALDTLGMIRILDVLQEKINR